MSKGAQPKTSAVNKTVEVASGIGEKKTEEKAKLEKSHEEKPTGNKKANKFLNWFENILGLQLHLISNYSS